MDMDLEEFNEIVEMTHSWPSPGPISPSVTKGSKGKDDLVLCSKGENANKAIHDKGKSKDDLALCTDRKSSKTVNPVTSNASARGSGESRETKARTSKSRGKNLAVLYRQQKSSEEPYFGVPISTTTPQEEWTSSTTPASQPGEKHMPSAEQMDSDSNSSDRTSRRVSRTSAKDEEAETVLEDPDTAELQDLAQNICQATDQELSAFVTRAMDLSQSSQVGGTVHCFHFRQVQG